MMQIQAALVKAIALLQKVEPESAALEARVLLGFVTGLKRETLLAYGEKELTSEQVAYFFSLVARRAAWEPLAYLLGEKEFFGRSFAVSPAVLIPRPETELLVEHTIRKLAGQSEVSLLDLCTGSGCIGLSILLERKKRGLGTTLTLSDLSPEALAVAKRNAESFGVVEQCRFVEGDLFQPFSGEKFAVIVANPPYVAQSEQGREPSVFFEPSLALYAADEGFALVRQILEQGAVYLESGGLLMIEMGANHQPYVEQCRAALEGQGLKLEVILDLAGRVRFVVVSPGSE